MDIQKKKTLLGSHFILDSNFLLFLVVEFFFFSEDQLIKTATTPPPLGSFKNKKGKKIFSALSFLFS